MQRFQKGFTLIEMLVVIAIISILIGIGINTFTIAQKKARDVRRKADIRAIQTALELYKQDKGYYPSTGGYYLESDVTTDYIPGLAPDYIPSLPQDPKGGDCSKGLWEGKNACYAYLYNPTPDNTPPHTGYRLYARLENSEDSETCNKKTIDKSLYGSWAGLNNGCPKNAGTQYGDLYVQFAP